MPDPQAAQATGAFRFFYNDQQIRILPDGSQQIYSAFHVKILRPEALAFGNLTLNWNPAAGWATVHRIRILRDGQPIDVLANAKFTTIQRETGLEEAKITGILTASLQVPGLRVGDELEAMMTIRSGDPTLAGATSGWWTLAPTGANGLHRMVLDWPNGYPLRWSASTDLGPITPGRVGEYQSFSVELREPKPVKPIDGAPARFNRVRLIQYTNFADWGAVSTVFHRLFDEATTLAPGSLVEAEAARIGAATDDPAKRALAALKLVQSEVRYVYVGLNGGNYQPMTAEETWQQRLGDCKAKTALLLALLKRLGVEAEPVLVNIGENPGVDQLLPSPAAFDHVLVRATIAGKQYWLDGTRMGDVSLAPDQPLPFRLALPVRANGAVPENIAATAPAKPLKMEFITLDLTKPNTARIKAEQRLRGDQAIGIRAQLSGMSEEAAADGLKTYWRESGSIDTVETVAWSFDEAGGVLTLKAEGGGHPDYLIAPRGETYVPVPRSGFFPPPERKRPPEQDQTAPWLISFPEYSCFVTNVLLPSAGPGNRWEFKSEPMDRKLGGISYYRKAELRDGVMRTIKIMRTERDELSATEAGQVNAAIPRFDNAVSHIFRRPTVRNFRYPPTEGPTPLPLLSDRNGEAAEAACLASLSP